MPLSLTEVTRCVSKRDVSPGGSPIRLRQHGTLVAFSQKHSQRECFCEKACVSSALLEAEYLSGQ
jgi:hypothetical protein